MKAPGRVFDIECDGFNPTKIHCLSASGPAGVKSTRKRSNIQSFCAKNILVGHNIIRFDLPILERLEKATAGRRVVDTLALSWYLYPNRATHGLADWGEEFGIPKPVVEDWDNQPYEVYAHRGEEDVKINILLWEKQWKYLLKLYGSEEKAWKLIDYLTFKMECARDQSAFGWMLDVGRCVSSLEQLSVERDSKVVGLSKVMPRVAVEAIRTRPKKFFLKGKLNTPSKLGQKWLDKMDELGLPHSYAEPIKEITGYEPPNPNSPEQVKSWLYSLGWAPTTFKYVRNKVTNEFRRIPQVRKKDNDNVMVLCDSVRLLVRDEPSIDILEGLTVLNHRLGLLEGFLRDQADSYLKAKVQGLTNTLRFKHREIANLPGTDKPYGEDVRGCLICPEGYELLGSDMRGLEDRTKQHYMWDYDPDYVTEMNTKNFDPHLDIGVKAGMLTQQQSDAYKGGDESLHSIRHDAKQVNYSCTYGITPKGLTRNTGMPLIKSGKLHKAYWKRNWSITAIADACEVKVCMGQKWLYSPVSQFWYTLRHAKDRFSTLNQGTGVYCFDTLVKHCQGPYPIIGQFHDEVVCLVKLGDRERAKAHFRRAIDRTNEELKLNIKLDITVEFGKSYADIH